MQAHWPASPSVAACARRSSKVDQRKLRTPFAERATPGIIAYMLAHQLQRTAVLHLNRDASGKRLQDRDSDGYPLPLAATGISHNFFDADVMAAGVENLNGKFYIPSNDQSGCVT